MDKDVDGLPLTFIKVRRLLGTTQHDEAWRTDIEATIATIGEHISAAQTEVESTSDLIIREQSTALIGELINTRQRLERALEEARPQSPSLLQTLKHTLGLDGKDKTEVAAPNPQDGPPKS